VSAATKPRPQVVVVEGDPDLRRLETSELEDAGFDVRAATSIDDAVQRGADAAPDCWLIDHRLSANLPGPRLVGRLGECGHDVPVVLMADGRDPAAVRDALATGVREVMLKGPGFTALLGSRVQATIDGARAVRELREAIARAKTAESRHHEEQRGHDEVRRSVDRLLQVDRRKDDFLALLGQELRNPLAPISNAVEVLRLRGEQPAVTQWATAVIARQLAHLRRLVDDLANATRAASGRVQLAFAPVLLHDVIADAVARCRAAIDAKGHRMLTTPVAENLCVYGDSARLEQALVNVLDNALKFTPERGNIEIVVASRDGEATIGVADDGVGIAAEDLASVFQMFVRNERDVPTSQSWFGAGLNFVRRIVELHGGRIDAASHGRGKGARFTIHLPLSRIGAPAPAPRHVPHALPDRRVVVIDTDADAGDALAELLRSWGFGVERADTELTSAAPVAHAVIFAAEVGRVSQSAPELAARVRQRFGPDVIAVALTNAANSREALARHQVQVVRPGAAAALQDALAPLLRG
jgi:signal transduction histidine kinase